MLQIMVQTFVTDHWVLQAVEITFVVILIFIVWNIQAPIWNKSGLTRSSILVSCWSAYDHFETLLSAKCNEDNYCSFWSFQEHMDTAEKRCFLMQVKMNESDRHKAFCFWLTQMQSCEKATVAPYPWITSSGSRDCLPEEYKRRKCRPGCGSRQALLWDKE